MNGEDNPLVTGRGADIVGQGPDVPDQRVETAGEKTKAASREDLDQGAGREAGAGPARTVEFGALGSGGGKEEPSGRIELIMDLPLPVTVELGRTSMLIRDILNLGPGSVVELNRIAGEPVDVLVNGKLIARGEVVVVDENFGVRLVDIVAPGERVTQ